MDKVIKEWYSFKKELENNINSMIDDNKYDGHKDTLKTMLSMLNDSRIKHRKEE
jgi:hypothetical protein